MLASNFFFINFTSASDFLKDLFSHICKFSDVFSPIFWRPQGYPKMTQDYEFDIAKLNGERHRGQREASGGVAGRALATRFPPKPPWLEATHHGGKE